MFESSRTKDYFPLFQSPPLARLFESLLPLQMFNEQFHRMPFSLIIQVSLKHVLPVVRSNGACFSKRGTTRISRRHGFLKIEKAGEKRESCAHDARASLSWKKSHDKSKSMHIQGDSNPWKFIDDIFPRPSGMRKPVDRREGFRERCRAVHAKTLGSGSRV